MSLDSCVACGHALAIADHRCRHCSSPDPARRGAHGIMFYVVVALAALLLAILLYNVFLR